MALRARKVSGAFEKRAPVLNKLTCMCQRSNWKTSTWSAVDFKRHGTSMSYKFEPAIWSSETGQQIPCFDMCQLVITCQISQKYTVKISQKCTVNQGCMSLSTYYSEYGRHLGQLRRRRRHRREKINSWVSFSSHMSMELRLVALRAAGHGAPLKGSLYEMYF